MNSQIVTVIIKVVLMTLKKLIVTCENSVDGFDFETIIEMHPTLTEADTADDLKVSQ